MEDQNQLLKDAAHIKIKNMYTQYGSPFFQAGKGCAKSEGGSGCIVKRGGKWAILNNKKGGIWRDGFNSEGEAEKALAAYHANS
mgnify:FL=1